METDPAFKGFCLDNGVLEASVRTGRCAPFRQWTVPAFVRLVRKGAKWSTKERESESQKKSQKETKRGGLMERWKFCYVKALGEGMEKGYVFLHLHWNCSSPQLLCEGGHGDSSRHRDSSGWVDWVLRDTACAPSGGKPDTENSTQHPRSHTLTQAIQRHSKSTEQDNSSQKRQSDWKIWV